jgi:hypothetical protein
LNVTIDPDCGWSVSAPELILIGFENEQPAICSTNASATAVPLPGAFPKNSCKCAAAGSMPKDNESDDCRLTDPDGDGRAGVGATVTGQSPGSIAYRYAGAFLNGEIGADGKLTAREDRRGEWTFVQCGTFLACANHAKPCDYANNRADFIRLEGDRAHWGCTEIVNKQGALFSSHPAFPPKC